MQNIILIVVDTLRPDHLGCYGYSRPTSPCLDSLASRGVVLDALWSASNFTAPAFTSLFTARYPSQHGVFDFTSQASGSPIKNCLDACGYQSAGVVTFRFFPNLLRHIWGPVEVVTQTRSFSYSKDLPWKVTEGASEWLRQHGREKPFCLFVHYDGPHMPYRLPAESAHTFDSVAEKDVDPDFLATVFPQEREQLHGRGHRQSDAKKLFSLIEAVNRRFRRLSPATRDWLIDKYDASIHYNDAAIGQLLDNVTALGLDDNTIVAVLSDHGEEFLEHGQLSHGHIHLYEEVIRSVGIIADPRGSSGHRLERPLSHIAIWPTLLRLAGVQELPPRLQDLEFSQEVSSPAVPESAGGEEPIFCVSKFKMAARSGRWKLIQALPSPHLPRFARWKLWAKMAFLAELKRELYDLEADPGEQTNLFGKEPAARTLGRQVREHLCESRDVSLVGGTAADLEEAERKRIEKELEDLGYM